MSNPYEIDPPCSDYMLFGERTVDRLYIADIANPGYGPILAVHAVCGERTFVMTDPRTLSDDGVTTQAFLLKVQERGEIDTDLWESASMSDAEREAYLGPGGDLWQWEEMEKANGNW